MMRGDCARGARFAHRILGMAVRGFDGGVNSHKLVPVLYSIFVLDLKIVSWGEVDETSSGQPRGTTECRTDLG